MDHEDTIAYREALGFLAGLTIGVIPEPTTLTLLALGSLILFRRPNPGTRRRWPMT